MMFFQRKHLNTVDIAQCNPIIVNQTNHSIVLFLDRGVLYNKQVLGPGQAVGMTRKETSGTICPYRIHAVVGDETSLPTRTQSVKNLISTAVIPTAFIIGTLAAASSAGTLTGPATALGRATGGLVIRGLVIDSAALAAGSLTASRAAFIAGKLMEQHPENFSAKSGLFMPGNRFVVIRGGIDEPLTIHCLKEKEFRQTVAIQGEIKTPLDTLQDKIEYYTPTLFRRSSTTTNVALLEMEADEESNAVATQKPTPPLALEQQAPPPKSTRGRGLFASCTTGQARTKAGILEIPNNNSQQKKDEEEEAEAKQMRQAIAESLRMEEERKRRDEEYQQKLKSDKRTPVVLF